MKEVRVDILPDSHPIVLFDGVCNLCNGAVAFMIERDRRDRFRFAHLQGETGTALLRNTSFSAPESILLLEEGHLYTRSDAVLRIARQLDGPYPLLYGLILLPRWLRDWLYDFIARNRYRWFGRKEDCLIPTPEVQARFLR